MRINLMIEGQQGVTWDDWVALADACEEHGLEGMFRSDHYRDLDPSTDRGSTDAWTLIGALAARTERIRLGTLVSPVTFRHPAVLAKAVVTADLVSNGRIELGMGAGWHRGEHDLYGFGFPDIATRYDEFERQVEVVHRHWVDEPEIVFDPIQQPHPPLIIGGTARRRSVAIAARFADEYNTVFASPDTCRKRRDAVARACEEVAREPIAFSLMTGCIIGETDDDVRRRIETSGTDVTDRVRDEWLLGTVDQVRDRLAEYEEAGVERVMLQHQDHRDIEMIALLGTLA